MSVECATDSELLARFVDGGDGDAFARIVERHGPMVYRICARFCTTRHDAEDAAQYVFATLARKAAMLHARTCLAGWLHRTASHTAQRWRRSAATRRRHEQQASALRPDFIQGGAGIDQLESLDQLQRALGALPEDYRNALILHHLQGYTIEEVAELLAAPPGTVAARLSRGRAMLRDRLAMLGLVLLGTDFDDLLLQAYIGPEAVPAALSQANYPAPLVSYGPKAAAPAAAAAVGCTGATPFICGGAKVKSATMILSLCFGTFACAATVASVKYVFPPAPVGLAPQVLPEPWQFSEVFPRSSPSSNVPEPSSLVLLVPGAMLILRRHRRKVS
jgi:RNA polymerase sigma factor (sigma-70 family)